MVKLKVILTTELDSVLLIRDSGIRKIIEK